MKINNILPIIFAYVCIQLLWWNFYPYKPLEIKQPLEIINENKIVKSGELVIYRTHFKKNTKVKPVIITLLINGLEYKVSEKTVDNEIGETDKVTGFIFPHELPPDTWYIKKRACYKINPIREVCVIYVSEKFTVIK